MRQPGIDRSECASLTTRSGGRLGSGGRRVGYTEGRQEITVTISLASPRVQLVVAIRSLVTPSKEGFSSFQRTRSWSSTVGTAEAEVWAPSSIGTDGSEWSSFFGRKSGRALSFASSPVILVRPFDPILGAGSKCWQ